MNNYDVIVIGAGQAGLAIAYYLQQKRRRFLLLDKNSGIGDSWRERYDSLVLFTPRRYCDLPGLPFSGERDGLPTKDEAANYLEDYVNNFQFPIQHETEVILVMKADTGFTVHTNHGLYHAEKLVVATGPFHTPYLPPIVTDIADGVRQIHTSHFKNEQQLKDGPVLIVGGGNSGAQLAVELAASRPVTFSMGQSRSFLPLSFLGKTIFDYMRATGLLTAPITSWLGKRLSKKPDPIFGYRAQLRRLVQDGQIRMVQKTVKITGSTATFAGGHQEPITNIIWATGFRPGYEWLDIPLALDEKGAPLHKRGVSHVSGLFFLGLPWQYNRQSALLGGVGYDAAYLATHL
ncbi:putative oxidoreductase CzcO [Brevibacillus reuszeri]|uniref:Oxidoreductase n=1 Tax=Brevibacillus reuszeri TaxID=54915 RepID=A0A0K9YRN6_9BACL|nr:NAD(P)/FAD-dependent oxidoreductase [Brevibacillus reuszeri]KNB71383.1 oxidoreductase [Brevibacillus reuszeri]MED1857837.1 NAD(P)/FAD-dependent oxidoreductase [Brevibacillus reuszeri]GED66332.1 putative oxidoreductase CzcO [Brevibacillus reuszeri]